MPTASMSKRPAAGRAGLVVDLARPYRVWLVVILVAMLLETIAGPAGPWPLKIIVDYAVGRHAAAAWVVPLLGPAVAADGRALAAMAAISLVLIAVLGGLASYIDSYYTESGGQWVANDLRMRVYDHLERLSFTYAGLYWTRPAAPAEFAPATITEDADSQSRKPQDFSSVSSAVENYSVQPTQPTGADLEWRAR